MNGPETIIATRHSGEILAEHTINTTKDYQPKKQKPVPKEQEFVNDDPRHLSTMS
jgi:hypothetical protein